MSCPFLARAIPSATEAPTNSLMSAPATNALGPAPVMITDLISVLVYLGIQPPSPVGERISQIGTIIYFAFFLAMPWWSRMGEFKPVPTRVNFVAH